MRESIVFIAAHPDDVADGPGGTAILLKENYDLHVVCATKGERGINGLSLSEAAEIREPEERAASGLLGAELTFLDIIDGEVFADRETCEKVGHILLRLKPVAVFALWPIRAHPDHSAMCEVAKKAIMFANRPVELIHWEDCEPDVASRFSPTRYVDIGPVMEGKADLIRCHKSQNGPDHAVRRVEQMASIRGAEAGCEYAEGFFAVPFHHEGQSVLDVVGVTP